MDNNQKKLSEYIDRLNAEKKPEQHKYSAESPELEKLMNTVRVVRSLKEPSLPDADYPKKLAHAVANRLSPKLAVKNSKRTWFAGVAAVAAVLIMAFMLNFILPFGTNNIVYAMEQAFQEMKAYHGFIEIIGTNAEGKQTIQAKREVWADKEGRYYIKELEGPQKGMITVNNGQKKWQIRPDEKQAYIFPAFPDPYRFTFELGKEVEQIKNAMETKVIGEDNVSGRLASILEVSPNGGVPYHIWIDKETKLPLQRQSGMQNALQSRITYTRIDFSDTLPAELIAYNLPDDFTETDTNPEQLVNNVEEAEEAVGFTPKLPEKIPVEYSEDMIAVAMDTKAVRLYYAAQDKQRRVVIIQGKSAGEFKPASTAALGKVGGSVAEIQSPITGSLGVLSGGGPYAGAVDVSSIRWQEGEFEYAVVGDAPLKELASFIEGLTHGDIQVPSANEKLLERPQIEIPVDVEAEENDQKSVDAGHSPWKLDPAYVAQVFVSLKISPEGIRGEYPIRYEDLKIIENTGKYVVIEVGGDETPIRKVYLRRLIRQDSTGIWTVVGYDPANE